MTRTSALLLLVIPALLCVLAVACGGDDDDAPASGPNVAARERYADEMVAKGYLRPPVPHYIPAGVSQTGAELNDATAEHIVVSYPPLGSTGGASAPAAPYLTVVANREPDGVQTCSPGLGPPPYAIQCLEVNGEPSMLQIIPHATTAEAFLATRIDDLSIFVTVDWPATSETDVPAAEGAKTEVVLVAQGLVID